MVSGAPWHMRTLKLDGAGNKNQDRSIQPSAIVGELAPQALAPATPRPTARPDAGRTAGDATPDRAADPARTRGDRATQRAVAAVAVPGPRTRRLACVDASRG